MGEQLELFERPLLSSEERRSLAREIRNEYWKVRAARGSNRVRMVYLRIAAHKKRLLEAGVEKSEVLALLACCRSRLCSGRGCLDCPQAKEDLEHFI